MCEHEVDHVQLVLLPGLVQVGQQLLFDILQLVAAHGVDLPYAEHRIPHCELLEILEADFLRTLALQVTACVEHLRGQVLQDDARNPCQLFRCPFIHLRAGGGAEKQGVRTASFYWVGSEYPIQGCRPSIWKPFDKNVPFSDRADSVIVWLQLPEEVRPHLIMWYMEEPDGVGHRATPDSSATLSTVEHLDRILGDFFAEARRLDIFDQIDFIVLSDHGMATYYPENYVNLNDYLPRDSFDYVFDGVPTLLYPKPTYTDSAYAILKRVPRVTVWRKNEIPEKFVYGKNPRIGDLFVLPDIGTYLQFRPESCPVFAATHGYDNFAPEMEAIFYAAGPSFKQNVELPVMANVNLYLIIARLLDLQPAPNDGDSVVVSTLFR